MINEEIKQCGNCSGKQLCEYHFRKVRVMRKAERMRNRTYE